MQGDVWIHNGQWYNGSNGPVQSATLECDQYNQDGSDLAQKQIPLMTSNEQALQSGYTERYNDLDIGQAIQGLVRVNCSIVAAIPPAQ